MAEYSILIKPPPHQGDGASFDQLGDEIERYEHVITFNGGYWTAQWWMPLNTQNTEDYLRTFFNANLGCAVQEYTGNGLTWEGVIWAMELTLGGLTRRLDRERIYNAVRAIATDVDGNRFDTATSTALAIDSRGFHVNEASINRYGRRELFYTLSDKEPAEAEADLQTQLTITAFPEAFPTGMDEDAEEGLMVECVGRVFLLNDRYVTVTNASSNEPLTIDTYIQEILAADVDSSIITPSVIAPNPVNTRRIAADGTPTLVWPKLEELTQVGDGTQPYRFWVGPGGRARYEPADPGPRYLWMGDGRITTTTNAPVSWEMEPAVVRDMAGRHAVGISTAAPSMAFVRDDRDMWVREITMTAGDSVPKLSPGDYNRNELLQNWRKHLSFFDRQGRRG